MHEPRPYGLHVIGGELTSEDMAFIDNAAKRFANLKNVSQVSSLKLVYDLPSMGSVIIQDAGGNFRVIAHKPQQEITVPTDGKAKPFIPMFFSGSIENRTWVRRGDGVDMVLTKGTRLRVMNYSGDMCQRHVNLKKFACEYNRSFSEFVPPNPPNFLKYIQSGHQHATWYSGAMAELMQIVGGYGIQELDELPNDAIEQAKFELPNAYIDRIAIELNNQRLPGYTGLPHRRGSFQCDYKHHQTDLIGFDDDRSPWLLRVNRRGVWAMPMPVIPATATTAFKEYVSEMGDTELLQIVNRFGAMPSGETFPSVENEFEAWRRAGVIIRICDVADFYKRSAYSSAMGWSANLDASEIVNTCYDYDYSTGLFYGQAFKIKLNLVSIKDMGWSDTSKLGSPEYRDSVGKYLYQLYDMLDTNTPSHIAIKYKLSKASLSDIKARAQRKFSQDELYYWDNLVLPPIAMHTGRTVEISKGYLYDSDIIKVPDPLLQGCVSLGFRYNMPPKRTHKTDVIVLAYYIGNEMKCVRFFSDKQEARSVNKNNYEKCMIVGKWKGFQTSGYNGIQGDIYLTDVDDREVLAVTETTTEIEGKDLGYAQPSFRFDAYFWRTALMWRSRYYTTKTNIHQTSNTKLLTASLMPYYMRNSAIYVKSRNTTSSTKSESVELNSIIDPNQYLIWTYHFSAAWAGGYIGKGTFPVMGRPVWAEELRYNRSGECQSFADSGPWIPAMPYDVTDMLVGYDTVAWALEGIAPAPQVDTYSDVIKAGETEEHEIKCSMYNKIDLVRKKQPSYRYFSKSPDSNNQVVDIDGCKVVFGDTKYANISEKNVLGGRRVWGYTGLVDSKSAHHFVGVINE